MVAFSFKEVCIDYRNRRIINNLNGDFNNGEISLISGQNGKGKSTLMRAMVGLQNIKSGKIEKHFNKNDIAYLPQGISFDLSFPINVFETVSMGLMKNWKPFSGYFNKETKTENTETQNENKDSNSQKIFDILSRMGLSEKANSPLYELSGGELQRTIFARIILQDSSVILLDEPFSNIDIQTVKMLIEQIKIWQNNGKTIILITHDESETIEKYAIKTLILEDGTYTWK